MARFLRVLLGVVAFLAALAGGAWLWLTAPEAVPPASDYRISLGELRRLGDSVPGTRPTAVYSELVARTTLPGAALFAGESFAPHPMLQQVWKAVLAQFRALSDLMRENPELVVVASHDGDQRQALIEGGLLTEGFDL